MSNEWTNWSGAIQCHPRQIHLPADEQEVAPIVRQAAKDGQVVRVAGSGHSFTPLCATDDVLLSLDRIAGIETVSADGQAWVRAGSKIHDLGGPLAERGWALENQGDVDVQAIAGAVSTGTHGTGVSLGNISTQVSGLRLVTANSEVIELSAEANLELFRAAQVSLGSLGVVTAIRLRLFPLYRLHEKVRREPLDECLENLDARIQSNRHYEFFWYPGDDKALTKTLNPTDRPPMDSTKLTGASEGEGLSDNERERIANSWEIFPTVRENRFNEMEYSLPADEGVACFLEIRQLMQQKHRDMAWPIEYRTQAADEILISAASERPTVAISIHQGANLPHEAFFADAEVIFRRHGGRPHWGKMHSLACRELRELYPNWDRFLAMRGRMDPQGRFLNGHLRRLFVD